MSPLPLDRTGSPEDMTPAGPWLHGLPLGAYRSRPDGTLVAANAALAHLHGYSSGTELVARAGREPPDWYVDARQRERLHAALEREGQVAGLVSEVRRLASGETLWVIEHAQLLRRADGSPAGFEVLLEPVTRRRIPPGQDHESHLHEVAEHFPGMAYRVHMPLNASRPARYSFVSRGVQQLYGVSAEDVVANPRVLRQFRHPDDSDRLDAEVAAAVRQAGQLLTTYRILVKGGIKWIQMSSSVVGQEDGEQVRVGAMVDVTAQVLAESLRRDRDRAEAARQEMTQFLSRVSHELRTPLNAILGFAQLIEAESDTPGLQRRWARGLMDSGRHLLALVEDVLDLSGAQSGQMALQSETVDLAPVLREAWAMVSADAQERGLDFSGLPLVAREAAVRADRRRLLQVLTNLLSNAVKYNRPGGRLGLHVRREDTIVAIAVCDGGEGLEPERLARLFTPFDRLGAQHTKVPGTGLGLALSRQLAERMGGSLMADSEPGRGSVFTLRLVAA